MPDIEDKEGEVRVSSCVCTSDVLSLLQTALHKAALHGQHRIIQYLLPDKADVHAQDADGWTALHNACSKVVCVNASFSALIARRDIWILSDGCVRVEVLPLMSMAATQ